MVFGNASVFVETGWLRAGLLGEKFRRSAKILAHRYFRIQCSVNPKSARKLVRVLFAEGEINALAVETLRK